LLFAKLQREGLLPIDCQILASFNISEEYLKNTGLDNTSKYRNCEVFNHLVILLIIFQTLRLAELVKATLKTFAKRLFSSCGEKGNGNLPSVITLSKKF